MAHSTQARKRIRQNEKSRQRNKAKSSVFKTAMKKLQDAVKAGDKQKAGEIAQAAIASVDKAAKSHVIHKNKAARHKSQIMRSVGAMK